MEVKTLPTQRGLLLPKDQTKNNSRKSKKKNETSEALLNNEELLTLKPEECADNKPKIDVMNWIDQNGLSHKK